MKRLFVLIFAVVCFGGAQGAILEIRADEVIDHGDYRGVYTSVDIYDSLDVPAVATTVDVVEGGDVGQMLVNETSVLNMYGGSIYRIVPGDSSMVNLYGGDLTYFAGVSVDSIINVYGYDFSTFMISDAHIGLAGLWADNTPFSFYFYRTAVMPEQVVLHEIPEPGTVLLLVLGSMFFRVRS